MSGTQPPFDPPADQAAAEARLQSTEIPKPVLEVVRELQSLGHAAVVVGGCVRDSLLGRSVSDWDVTTSARPEQVIAGFRRTIPTGLEHGTVTVLVGRTSPKTHVEVTTFRGEGGYVDGRRPDQIVFLDELVGDLERRDFTINALAWDPIAGRLTDAFGGLQDLRQGSIRAVGDARTRLREDGLRTMRAVRFAATLEFSIEAATAAAIPQALDVFEKVSRERVRVELVKLLAARRCAIGLSAMVSTQLWDKVLAPLPAGAQAQAIADAAAISHERPFVRLAALLRPSEVPAELRAAVLDALKLSRRERVLIDALHGRARVALEAAETPPAIRKAVAQLGIERLEDVIEYSRSAAERADQWRRACEGAVLESGQMAVRGRDLIAAGIAAPGPELGRLMARLFDACLDDPSINDEASLLDLARRCAGQP